jgi:hypothetical protein
VPRARVSKKDRPTPDRSSDAGIQEVPKFPGNLSHQRIQHRAKKIRDQEPQHQIPQGRSSAWHFTNGRWNFLGLEYRPIPSAPRGQDRGASLNALCASLVHVRLGLGLPLSTQASGSTGRRAVQGRFRLTGLGDGWDIGLGVVVVESVYFGGEVGQ